MLALLTGGVLATANRGFDLTDEAYYLFWIAMPARFSADIHPFGLFFHPFFVALGSSIVAVRMFGVALLLGCGAGLGEALDRYYRSVGHRFSFDARIMAAVLALANYAIISVLTPSYNLLSNCAGCVLVAGSLLWATDDDHVGRGRRELIDSVLVGVGGCMAFFAKPTFAAIAALAIAIQLGLQLRTVGWSGTGRRVWITAAACLVPLLAIIADTVGVGRFVETLSTAMQTLDFGNSPAQLPMKTLADLGRVPRPLIVTLPLFLAAVVWKLKGPRSVPPWLMLVGGMGLLALDLIYFASKHVAMVANNASAFTTVAAPACTVALAIMIVGTIVAERASLTLRRWWPVAVLLFLPLATAFGTANDLIPQTAVSLYATLLAVVIAADLLFGRRISLAVGAMVVGYVAVLLLWSARGPYGLPAPLWEQTRPFRVAQTGDTLYLDAVTVRYLAGLRDAAARGHLTPDTPIIDLSGGGPGTAMALNANAPFFPWVVPLYGHGSQRLADTIWLSLTPAQQRAAWFVGPVHPAFAQSQVAQRLSLRRADYARLAHLPMDFRGNALAIEVLAPAASPR